MEIKELFLKDIFRSINGVVKAEQLDNTSILQELDEFVVTKELLKHFDRFFLHIFRLLSISLTILMYQVK